MGNAIERVINPPDLGSGYSDARQKVLTARVAGDSFDRVEITAGGDIKSGDGTAAPTTGEVPLWIPASGLVAHAGTPTLEPYSSTNPTSMWQLDIGEGVGNSIWLPAHWASWQVTGYFRTAASNTGKTATVRQTNHTAAKASGSAIGGFSSNDDESAEVTATNTFTIPWDVRTIAGGGFMTLIVTRQASTGTEITGDLSLIGLHVAQVS